VHAYLSLFAARIDLTPWPFLAALSIVADHLDCGRRTGLAGGA
jgi:hypothetical protein